MVSLERGRERDVEAKVRYIWFTARKVEKAETKEKGERERREVSSVCSREDGMVHQESKYLLFFMQRVKYCDYLTRKTKYKRARIQEI